ncbi:polyketide cyclase/dehydrase and lipid transport superfamily protein [Actinidia rufa]|uniref:Polyketide cyclase/dehydrase and lipid transport superfamily protein n=1 Tax=Actinidia rufa TaxID=165716 RepID=A0A7J0GTQ7_9ERIC|nr:polyketide cyclase/dehydrase and lipid transport superfamily protein [Actinidia rufa]
MRSPYLARRHDRPRDRMVLAAQVDRPRLPRPPVQAPLRLDRPSWVRRPPALARLHGRLGALLLPDALVQVQGKEKRLVTGHDSPNTAAASGGWRRRGDQGV